MSSTTGIRVLSFPSSGAERIPLTPGENLQFSFDPGSVTFSRSGSDLILTDGNASSLTMVDFFKVEQVEALPKFILPDGGTVPGADYLKGLNIDISTAAGPATPPSSSGEGEYSDNAGSLLTGLDRLDSLGTDHWERASGRVDEFRSTTLESPTVGASGEASVPDLPMPGWYQARAVLYMHDRAGEPYTNRSVTAQALLWDKAAGTTTDHVGPVSAMEAGYTPADMAGLVDAHCDPVSGKITFMLTAAGEAWMAANPAQNIVTYFTVHTGGAAYAMQVVLTHEARFDSHAQDAADQAAGIFNGLIHGEWHEGEDVSAASDYRIVSSDLADDLKFTGEIKNVRIATGAGGDTMTVEGRVGGSSIGLGRQATGVDADAARSGDHNTLSISGNTDKTEIYGTAGADTVHIGKPTARAVVTNSTIDTGSGSGDLVIIDGRLGAADVGKGLGGGTGAAVITAEEGTVNVHSRGDAYALLAQSGSSLGIPTKAVNEITAETIAVEASGGTGTSYALYAQSKNTNDTVYNKLTGETVGVTAVAGSGSSAAAAALWADGYVGRTTHGYNEITGHTVTLTARGTSGANKLTYAMEAMKGAENRVHGDADGATLSLKAELGVNHGMHALSEGKNLVDGFSTVTVKAGGTADKAAYGMFASTEGENRITGRDMSSVITLTASGEDRASGMRTDPNGHNLIERAGRVTVDVETTSASATYGAHAMSANGGGTGVQNTIQNVNIVTLHAAGQAAAGMWAAADGVRGAATTPANLIAEVGEARITADGQGATGMFADGYTNEIRTVARDVVVTASAGNALYAANHGKNTVTGVQGDVDLNGGVKAVNNGANTVKAGGGVHVVKTNGGNALHAEGGGTNTLVAHDDISIKVTGGSTRYAMYTAGNSDANHLEITNPGGGTVALTGAMYSENGGTNSILTGNGENLVTVDGGVRGTRTGTAGAYTYSNIIETGTGNDTVALTGGSRSGTLSQITGTLVDLGEGDNLFLAGLIADTAIRTGNYDGINLDPHAWSGLGNQLQNCEIRGGDGNDTLLVQGDLRDSSIFSGDGDDVISIQGTVGSSSIDAGAGHNRITITGSLSAGAELTAEDGNNTIVIDGTGTPGCSLSTITLGNGDNDITIRHGTNPAHNAVSASLLALGDGDNHVRLDGNMSGSTLKTGDGDNTVTIDGSLLSSSDVSTGNGNDTLTITATMDHSKVDLGGGDDRLSLTGLGTGNTIDAGGGFDVLHLGGYGAASGGAFSLGDLLAGNSINGFEGIDLSGQWTGTGGTGGDTKLTINLSDLLTWESGLDGLLEGVSSPAGVTPAAGNHVVVTGDAGDRISLSSGDFTKVDTGPATDGNGIAYDVYSYTSGAETHYLLVQQEILLA